MCIVCFMKKFVVVEAWISRNFKKSKVRLFKLNYLNLPNAKKILAIRERFTDLHFCTYY